MARTSLLCGLALVLAAFACVGSDPTAAPDNQQGPDAGSVNDGAVGTSSSFDVTVSTGSVRLVQEGTAPLTVTVTRKNGFAGPIDLSVIATSSNVSADPLSLGPTQAEGTLTLRAAKSTPQGVFAGVTLRASSPGAEDATVPLNVFVRGKAGVLDTTYGNGGHAEGTAFTSEPRVAVDAKGRVYAYGPTNSNGTTLLERITAAGKRDVTFVAEPNTTISGTNVVALESGVMLCGQSSLSTPSIAVARWKEAGNLDTTFGNNGVATKAFGSIGDVYAAVGACVSDGNRTLVTSSRYGDPSDPTEYAVTWVDTNGKNLVGTAASTSFGRGGFTASAVYLLVANALQKLDPGTRAVDAAYTPNVGNAGADVAVASDGTAVTVGPTSARRFFPDGSTDQGFNAPAAGLPNPSVVRVLVQPDGKVVVLYVTALSPGSCQVIRYTANGSLDETFGEGGKTEGITPCVASAIGFQPDGGIIVAGKNTLRFWGD
jgi:uncharacterized delta-60 repeat protein